MAIHLDVIKIESSKTAKILINIISKPAIKHNVVPLRENRRDGYRALQPVSRGGSEQMFEAIRASVLALTFEESVRAHTELSFVLRL